MTLYLFRSLIYPPVPKTVPSNSNHSIFGQENEFQNFVPSATLEACTQCYEVSLQEAVFKRQSDELNRLL